MAVARVREDFLVAGHGGIEHHLTDRGARSSNRNADKDRAVRERQNGVGRISL